MNPIAEFKSGDKTYRVGRMDVFKQNNLMRRLVPLGGALVAAYKLAATSPIEAFKELGNALGRLSDEEFDYLQKTCLAEVQRRQGDLWVKVYSPGGNLQFDDIELLELNEIVYNVLKANLSGFFAGLVQRGWVSPQKVDQPSSTSQTEKTS